MSKQSEIKHQLEAIRAKLKAQDVNALGIDGNPETGDSWPIIGDLIARVNHCIKLIEETNT